MGYRDRIVECGKRIVECWNRRAEYWGIIRIYVGIFWNLMSEHWSRRKEYWDIIIAYWNIMMENWDRRKEYWDEREEYIYRFQVVLRTIMVGFVDSLKGTVAIFYLDKDINEARRASAADLRSLRRVSDHPLVKQQMEQSDKPQQQQKPQNEMKVLKRTLQCCGLNGGIFWLSIALFEGVLLPFLKYFIVILLGETSIVGASVWSFTHTMLTFTFSTIWVMPLLLLSKIVNSLWFQDIADSAYRHTRGRPKYLSSFGKLIADALFSCLIQFLFLIQTLIVSFFPVAPFGYLFSLVHTCMLYSLYSFEYKMYNMGWELHRRLNFIETNWPYFIGFGLPLSILTSQTSSYIISGCIFSILFPLFIISANEAEPLTDSTSTKLKLFSPVIAISNALFHRTMTPLVTDKSRLKQS